MSSSFFGYQPEYSSVPSASTSSAVFVTRPGHTWKIEITESGSLQFMYSSDGETFVLISSFLPV